MKNLIFAVVLAGFLAGCLAKSASPEAVYTFSYENHPVPMCLEAKKKSIFVKADTSNDSKHIFKKDGYRLVKISGKLDLFYSELMAKLINFGLENSCGFTPSASVLSSDMMLEIKVLELASSDEFASISMLYTLLDGGVVKKSGVINSFKKLNSSKDEAVFSALNAVANEIVANLISNI